MFLNRIVSSYWGIFLLIMPVIERQINEREDDILRDPINNENKEESAKDIDYLLEKIIGPAGK